MPPTLHIQLLGEFRLALNHQPITGLNQRRQQALLAFLLLHRRAPQQRHYIAFSFWPDSTDGQALTNLRKLYFQLRQAAPFIDNYVVSDSQNLGWRNDAHFTFDVMKVEQALSLLEQESKSDVAAVQRVMTLYQGELLPACYEEWLLPIRRALHERVVNTLTQAISKLEGQHEFQQALRTAEHLLRLDPLHEAAYRHLMHLRSLSGDRTGALRVYHECMSVLEQELAVSPTPETQALYQHILRADAQPTHLSKSTELQRREHIPLVGRKQEWEVLQQAWRTIENHRPRLLTVWGEAGIGKTRLVEELLHWARLRPGTAVYARAYEAEGTISYGPIIEWLRHDILYKGLEQLEPLWQTELARLLPELLIHHPQLPPPESLNETWQRHRFYEALGRAVLTAPKPCLFVLDDLQWVDAETLSWLRYLLRFTPKASLLVVATVRSEAVDEAHPLRDWLRQIQREGQCAEIELAPLTVEETTTLAEHLASTGELSAKARLFEETEGNPLFIVEMVRGRFLSEKAAGKSSSSLPPTVQAVIGARLAQLSSPARMLAQVAATIGRSFSASILATASEVDEDTLVQGLDELWRRRLVREQGEGYDFSHDKIREVAYAQLSRERRRRQHRQVAQALERTSTQEVDAISGQIAAHWEAAGETVRAALFFERAGKYAADRLAIEDAIRYYGRALTYLPDTEGARRYVILLARYKFLNAQGKREAERADLTMLQTLVQTLPQTPEATRQRAEVALCAARYWFGVEDRTQSKIAAREAVDLAEECEAFDLATQAYWHWGASEFWDKSNYVVAQPLLEKALQLARVANLPRSEAEALNYLAMHQLYSGGDAQLAESMLREALAIYLNAGDVSGEAFMLGMLAYLIIIQGEGRYAEAIGYCQQALTYNIEAIGWDATRFALGGMGYCLYLAGEVAQGLAAMEKELALAQQAESPGSAAGALWGIGILYFDLGDYRKAEEILSEAIRLLQLSDSYPYQVKLLGLLTLVYDALGQPEQARRCGEEAIALNKTVGDTRLEAAVCIRFGRALVAQNEWLLAKELFERGLLLHRQMKQHGLALRALAGLADVALRQDEKQSALNFVEQIMPELATRELDATDESLYVYVTCFHVLAAMQDSRSRQMLDLADAQLQKRASSLTSEEHRRLFWSAPTHEFVLKAMHQPLAILPD